MYIKFKVVYIICYVYSSHNHHQKFTLFYRAKLSLLNQTQYNKQNKDYHICNQFAAILKYTGQGIAFSHQST